MHVGCVSLEEVHLPERGEVPHGFGLEGVAVVALQVSAVDAVLEGARVILLGLDDLAAELDALEALGREGVDVDGARVDEDADGVAVGGVRIGAVDIALEQLWVVALDVLRSDDDLDLRGEGLTV